MTGLDVYARQSPYSDPRRYAPLLDALPSDIGGLTAAVRNLVVHYRASGIDFPPDRIAEIDHRWVDRMLATDQSRHHAPLTAAREPADRIVGCCRDFTLLTVAALRHRGVPARSRIGFAGYFVPGWHHDHVVVEYWDGERWVWVDAELDPDGDWAFDPADIPHPAGGGVDVPFASAAAVWRAYRAGQLDVETYGVNPSIPARGAWFVRNYVLLELAHRRTDELLLWDGWGIMGGPDAADRDLATVDEVAALLLAADAAEATADSAEAEAALRHRYEQPGLHPQARIRSHSPTTGEERWIDLETRAPLPLAP